MIPPGTTCLKFYYFSIVLQTGEPLGDYSGSIRAFKYGKSSFGLLVPNLLSSLIGKFSPVFRNYLLIALSLCLNSDFCVFIILRVKVILMVKLKLKSWVNIFICYLMILVYSQS